MYEIYSIPIRLHVIAVSSHEVQNVANAGLSALQIAVVKGYGQREQSQSAPSSKTVFLIRSSSSPTAVGAVTGLHGDVAGQVSASVLASCSDQEYTAAAASASTAGPSLALTLQARNGAHTRQARLLSLGKVLACKAAGDGSLLGLDVIALLQIACISGSTLSGAEYNRVLRGQHGSCADPKHRALLRWAFEQAVSTYGSYCAWTGRPHQPAGRVGASSVPAPAPSSLFTDVTTMINSLSPSYTPHHLLHAHVQQLVLKATKGEQELEMKSYQKQAVNWMLQRELRHALTSEVAHLCPATVSGTLSQSAGFTQPQLHQMDEEDDYDEEDEEDAVCDVDIGGAGGPRGPAQAHVGRASSGSAYSGVITASNGSAVPAVVPAACLRALANAVRARHPTGCAGTDVHGQQVSDAARMDPKAHPLWSAVSMYYMDSTHGLTCCTDAFYWNPYNGCVLNSSLSDHASHTETSPGMHVAGVDPAAPASSGAAASTRAISKTPTAVSQEEEEEEEGEDGGTYDGVQRGGMLCDEPGVGKTVECIGLILANAHSSLQQLLQADKQAFAPQLKQLSLGISSPNADLDTVLAMYQELGRAGLLRLEAGLLELAAATLGRSSTRELTAALQTGPISVPRGLQSDLKQVLPLSSPDQVGGGVQYPLPLDDSSFSYASRATVIVMPTNIIEQWREEAAAWAPSLKVVVFGGTAALEAECERAQPRSVFSMAVTPLRRAQLVEQLKCGQLGRYEYESLVSAGGDAAKAGAAKEELLRSARAKALSTLCLADVVLVSYDTLANDIHYQAKGWATGSNLRQKEAVRSKHIRSPLLSIAWHRVILDESQMIEGPPGSGTTSTCSVTGNRRTEMALQLQGPLSYRWCVSGTPFSEAEQVRTLFTFLRHNPFHDNEYTRNWAVVLSPLLQEGKQAVPDAQVDDDDDDDDGTGPTAKRTRVCSPPSMSNPVLCKLGRGLALLANLVKPLLWRNTLQKLNETGELVLPPVEHTVIIARPGPVEQQALIDYMQLSKKDVRDAMMAPVPAPHRPAAASALVDATAAGLEELEDTGNLAIGGQVAGNVSVAPTSAGWACTSPAADETPAHSAARADEDESISIVDDSQQGGAAGTPSTAVRGVPSSTASALAVLPTDTSLRRSKRKRGEEGQADNDVAVPTSTPPSTSREIRLLTAPPGAWSMPRSKVGALSTPSPEGSNARGKTQASATSAARAAARKVQELTARATELGCYRLDQLRKMCVLLYLSTDAVAKLELRLFQGHGDTSQFAEAHQRSTRKRGRKHASVLRMFTRASSDAAGSAGPSVLTASMTMSEMFRSLVNREAKEVEERTRQLYKVMLQVASATELFAEKLVEKAQLCPASGAPSGRKGAAAVTPALLAAQKQARQHLDEALNMYEEGLRVSFETDVAERETYAEAAAAVRSFMKLDSSALAGVARLCSQLASWPGTTHKEREAYNQRRKEAYQKWNEDVLQPAMAGKLRLEFGESIAQARNPLARLTFQGSTVQGAQTRTWMHYLARPEHMPDVLLKLLAEWADTTKGVVFPFRGSHSAFDRSILHRAAQDRALPQTVPTSLRAVLGTGAHMVPLELRQGELWKRLTDVRTCYAHLNDEHIFYNLSNMSRLTPFDKEEKAEAYFNLQSFDHTLQPVPERHPSNHATLMVDISLCTQAEYLNMCKEMEGKAGGSSAHVGSGGGALMQLYAANGLAVPASSASGTSSSSSSSSSSGMVPMSEGTTHVPVLPTAEEMLRLTELDEKHNNGPTSSHLLERAERLESSMKKYAELMGNYDRMFSCQCVQEALDNITYAMRVPQARGHKATVLHQLKSLTVFLGNGSVRPVWGSIVRKTPAPLPALVAQTSHVMKGTGTGSTEWFLHISEGGEYVSTKRERMQHADAVHRQQALLQQDDEGILPWTALARPPPPAPELLRTEKGSSYGLKRPVPYSPYRIELIARDLDALFRLPGFILEYRRMGVNVRDRQRQILQTLAEACESENERVTLPWPKSGSKTVHFASEAAESSAGGSSGSHAADDDHASVDEIRNLLHTLQGQKNALQAENDRAESRLRYKEMTLTTIERMQECRQRASHEADGVKIVSSNNKGNGTATGTVAHAEDVEEHGDRQCVICLNAIEDKENDAEKEYGPPVLLPCGHILHVLCYSRLKTAAENNGNQPLCPPCRAVIDTSRVCPLLSSISVIGGVVKSVDLSWYVQDALGGGSREAGTGSAASASSSSASAPASSPPPWASPSRQRQKEKGLAAKRQGGVADVPLPAAFDAFGTKVNVLLEYLRRMPEGEKAVVVCSFHDMLPVLRAAVTMLDEHLQASCPAPVAVPQTSHAGAGAGAGAGGGGAGTGTGGAGTSMPVSRVSTTSTRLKAVILHGSGQERARVVESFNTDPAVRILLLQSEADCAGLTLTAANHLFVVDPVLSQATMSQLVGRICRQGQTKPCYVYHLLQEKTVEEQLFKRRVLSSSAGVVAARQHPGSSSGEGTMSSITAVVHQQLASSGSSSAKQAAGPAPFELHDILSLFGAAPLGSSSASSQSSATGMSVLEEGSGVSQYGTGAGAGVGGKTMQDEYLEDEDVQ